MNSNLGMEVQSHVLGISELRGYDEALCSEDEACREIAGLSSYCGERISGLFMHHTLQPEFVLLRSFFFIFIFF